MKPETFFHKWSAALNWFFIVTEGIFLLLFTSFLLIPCQAVERFEKYKDKVGAVYDNIDYHSYASRLVPLFFVVKRVTFAVGCWYVKS